MDGKRIRCLQIVSQHVPIYLQQFPSYSNCKCNKSAFSRTAAHIFVSHGDEPATITQYVKSSQVVFNELMSIAQAVMRVLDRPEQLMVKFMNKSINVKQNTNKASAISFTKKFIDSILITTRNMLFKRWKCICYF